MWTWRWRKVGGHPRPRIHSDGDSVAIAKTNGSNEFANRSY
jgi:hypothetical protein